VKVPAIVSQETFDKVQARLQRNIQRYRHPAVHYLLKGLIECGECGFLFSPYQLTCIAEGYGRLGQPAEGLRKLRDAEH
jgi:hypothetical protein